MSIEKYNGKQLYLGIDGGGSKCRAIIFEQELGVIAEAISGPANALRGRDKAINHIIKATDEALSQLSLPTSYKSQLIAGIGLAGLNLESCLVEMQSWQHPFKQAFFTSDLHIACIGAHSGNAGAVMIVGTGSSSLVTDGDSVTELGGHGFPVGDCGSGAWFGLKAIELTLQAMDEVIPSSALTSTIKEIYKVDKAIELAQLVSFFAPADFAKLAPVVIEHANKQDIYASELVADGAQYLSKLASNLMQKKSLPLALIGGLAPLMAEHFAADVKAMIKPADNPPEIGAILFAQQNS